MFEHVGVRDVEARWRKEVRKRDFFLMDEADGGVRSEKFVEFCDGFCQIFGGLFLIFDRPFPNFCKN